MDLSKLKPAAGSVKARKRVGRGTGSGLGGTSNADMERNHIPAMQRKSVLKVDKCPSSVVFQVWI